LQAKIPFGMRPLELSSEPGLPKEWRERLHRLVSGNYGTMNKNERPFLPSSDRNLLFVSKMKPDRFSGFHIIRIGISVAEGFGADDSRPFLQTRSDIQKTEGVI
jgi:hypothetical protein